MPLPITFHGRGVVITKTMSAIWREDGFLGQGGFGFVRLFVNQVCAFYYELIFIKELIMLISRES